MPQGTDAPFTIRKGNAYVLFAYDIGQGIDLAECQGHLTGATEPARIEHRHRAPAYFQFEPPPLRVTEAIAPISMGPYRTSGAVEAVLFDFGAISITYAIPFNGSLDDLAGFSTLLGADDLLRKDSLRHVERLLGVIRRGVRKVGLSSYTEDYVIFQITDFDSPEPLETFPARHAQAITRILRAEKEALSEGEVSDALAARIAYGPGDLTLIDWNAALIVDREAEDVRAVLEFANVELLEMRFLDRQLDEALDGAYDVVSAGRWRALRPPAAWRTDLRKIGEMQVDAAILFERVTNALKLLGDQYLARVHTLASHRFHLPEWNASILRKIETIESIYRKVHDRAASLRMEVLEWIIVVLIALSILLPFLPGFPH